jgi:NAD-dependent dihydropyrimidine dehydrogenase PreA subunit
MIGLKYLREVVTLRLDPEKCSGCAMCLEVCPHGVFAIEAHKAAVVDRDACMECGACQQNCPAGAISVRTGVGCAGAVIARALRRPQACCSG